MFLYILCLPLFSFIILFFFSNYLGRSGVLFYSILNISLVNLFSLFLFFNTFLNNLSIYLLCGNWFKFLNFDIIWIFRLDTLSISMIYVVTIISLFVHIYSIDYMYSDPNRSLFLGYLSLFTFFMLILVCSGNLYLFFLSWEGVGVCSYLLINFWNSRIVATQSAIKAILVNRISDLFLLSGLVQLGLLVGSSDIDILELCNVYISSMDNIYVNFYSNVSIVNISCFFLFIGVVGKSAQLLLHTWLPDAMEGPTPVSALLHAATMVTAGIFLVLRFSFLFENNIFVLEIAGFLGSITIIVSGLIGLFQFDIKKIIAYSTCSQLGYMLVACSASVYYISLYHFTIHAFFKALLFLLSGCIIHSLSNEQDIRKYGGLFNIFPLCFLLFLVGTSALVAEPFLSGYYSKELIIFSLNDVYISTFNLVYWFSFYGAILTVLYSSRSLWLVFFSNFRGYYSSLLSLIEIPYILVYPLLILGICSIISGYVYSGIFRDGSLFNIFLTESNHMLLNHYIYDFLSFEHNYILIICNIIFLFLFLFFNYLDFIISSNIISVCKIFFINKWFFDHIYNRVLILNSLTLSEYTLNAYLDKGFIEFLGPLGIFIYTYKFSKINFFKNYTIYLDFICIVIYFSISTLVLLFSYNSFTYIYVT